LKTLVQQVTTGEGANFFFSGVLSFAVRRGILHICRRTKKWNPMDDSVGNSIENPTFFWFPFIGFGELKRGGLVDLGFSPPWHLGPFDPRVN
jgi:hypothetical protein